MQEPVVYILSHAPPSLNNAYSNRLKGRTKTAAYKQWIDAAGMELNIQRIRPITGPYMLRIEIGRSLTRADIDNLIKPIADLLVKMGATDDDRCMEGVSIAFTGRSDVLIEVSATMKVSK